MYAANHVMFVVMKMFVVVGHINAIMHHQHQQQTSNVYVMKAILKKIIYVKNVMAYAWHVPMLMDAMIVKKIVILTKVMHVNVWMDIILSSGVILVNV